MNTDKFDELIKSKVDEAQFDFNPEHWEKASQMIDRERALQKNNPASYKKYWVGLLLLFLLTLSGVFAIYLNTFSNKGTIVTNSNQDLGVGHLLAFANPTEKSSDAKDITIQIESFNQNNNIIKETNNVELNANQQNESKTDYNAQSKTSAIENDASTLKENRKNYLGAQNLSGTNDFEENDATSINESYSAQNKGKDKLSGDAFHLNNDKDKEEITAYLFLPNLAPKFTSPINEELAINDDLLRANTLVLKKDDDYYRDKKPKKQFLNLEGNAFYNQGWTSINEKKANALNFNLGVNYGFYLSRKVSASFGAHFYTIRNVNQSIYSDTVSNFNFGVNRTSNTIINNQLAYVAIPIQVNFHLNRKNYLSAGVNIGTKVYSRNTILTSQYIGEQLISTNNERNNFNYFNVADRNMMLEASYTGNVAKRLWLKAGVYYGVNDLFQQVNGIQNLKGVNIGIKYEIFDK
ncbi:MAG: hypothetical protein ACK5QC_01460 [Bacteroidota bacterium]